MAVTQTNYNEIAEETIRNFLQSVVLIDDHWSEAQSAPMIDDVVLSQVDFTPQTILPQEGTDPVDTVSEGTSTAVLPRSTDPAYLREIGTEITNQGLLFTGFSYKDSVKETAFKLASKSDILILDWYLGTEDSRPALSLLESLKDSGSPRFIFILTDQNLDVVRTQISEQLGTVPEGTEYIFSCGPFSFSLKNKKQTDGPNSVVADQVLNEAIAGIRARFGGLLQLAALELLGQYRECLHEVLDHFHSDTDLPFVLEWLEKDSPISDSLSFNSLAIDEWTARVFQRFPASTAQTIKNETVSALLTKWKETTMLPEGYEEKLKEAIREEDTPFPSDAHKAAELIKSLEEWMGSPKCCWPVSLNGLKRGASWPKSTKRILAMSYLGLRKGISSPTETLAGLDVLFQCQAHLPPYLYQGTVLQASDGTYLVCITPTCDCRRPARIKHSFVFLEAQEVSTSNLKDHPEGVVVAVRTQDKGNHLLAVTLKPTFTYRIANPSLNADLEVSFTLGSKETFILKPIAQLRPSRIQSLISLAAGKSIEVGLSRSELLRQLCKPN